MSKESIPDPDNSSLWPLDEQIHPNPPYLPVQDPVGQLGAQGVDLGPGLGRTDLVVHGDVGVH